LNRRGTGKGEAPAESADAHATRLLDAFERSTQIAPLTAKDRDFDVDRAYDVLHRLHGRRLAQGWRPLGRKIGFTNRTIWPRYGVYQPMWSFVWDRTVTFARQGRAMCPLSGLMEPRIEPEVVFRLKGPIPPGDDVERVLAATEWLAPGFEIVHSVFPGWKFTAPDCTAAFGLHGRLTVGEPLAVTDRNRAALARLLSTFTLTLRRGDEVIDTGVGANVLDNPANAILHLRDVLAGHPQFPPLAAGEIVTTGTVTDAWPVVPGEVWTSDYGELGLASLTVATTA
jgi:2-oxo-3-hexenedioate decarboxylase